MRSSWRPTDALGRSNAIRYVDIPEEGDLARVIALDLGDERGSARAELVIGQLGRRSRRARHQVDDADAIVEQLALLGGFEKSGVRPAW